MLRHMNNVLRADSYKYSHWRQYPPDTEHVYSYLESRGGLFQEVVFFGLQPYLQYLSEPITRDEIDAAQLLIDGHMGPGTFNLPGFNRILTEHHGLLPVRIRAVPEGTVVPTRNVLMTIENTDPTLPWVTNFVETLLLKVWYPTTVATLSRAIKVRIKRYLDETGDPAGLPFKLHDFGYRGVSSEESAALGGVAHLVNFMGTDTVAALQAAREWYGDNLAGYSIPAAEHSTIMAWTSEEQAFENMVKQFGAGALYAVVSDTYNIYDAVKRLWGDVLRQRVLDAPATLVVRPDSGVPHEVVRQVVELLGDAFGYESNRKGYKVLNKVRVIQGDGIDYEEIGRILEALKVRGWSADNIAFGMGGALLQRLDRDTQRFAIKASAVQRNGQWREIHKSPVTDNAKRSKAGKLKLLRENDTYTTVPASTPGTDVLQTVWENGLLVNWTSLSEIRQRADLPESADVSW